MNPEGEIASPTEPLPVRLFRLRLDKLILQRGLNAEADAQFTRQQLQCDAGATAGRQRQRAAARR